jgi:hypothetical protein
MRPAIRYVAFTLAAAGFSGAAVAQSGSPATANGFALTPYLGVLIPTAALLNLPKTAGTPGGAPLKLSAAITVGARLGIGLGDFIALDADVGYSPGSLEFDSTGAKANQDVKVLSGSGRLTVYVIPRTSPVWLGVSGGVAAVRHTFSKNATSAVGSGVQDGTNVGGVVGASAGIRLGQVLALNFGAEDYLYNATFDVNGAKTAERKQHDIRLTAGIRVPFLGF